MGLVVYEDNTFSNFFPLSYLRPVFELKCGMSSLAVKIKRAAGAPCDYFVRDWLAESYAEKADGKVNDVGALGSGTVLAVNGRLLALNVELSVEGPEEAAYADGALVYARADATKFAGAEAADFAAAVEKTAESLPRREVDATMVSYFYELIHHNPDALQADFEDAGKSGVEGTLAEGSYIWGPAEQLYIAPGAVVQPCVVIDTTGGPVYIDRDVVVNPHTRIEGPGYIGPGSMIVGGKIREGTSIGPVCRVGGEVEESIIHGYSNKYHDGFLGHAYVCEWVNIGAVVTNSDLKNDYTTVKVMVNGELADSGDTKVGAFIGDHTKAAIGSMFNTGTVIGIMSNVVGTGCLAPKYVPNFVTFLDNKLYKHALTSALTTARTAMGRRKKEFTGADENLVRFVRDLTKSDTREQIKRFRSMGAQ